MLQAPQQWSWAKMDVQFSIELPLDELVQSVHVVGFVGDDIVICRDSRPDVWFLPGGTREPGESLGNCLTRELREEAGARLTSPFQPLGAHVGTSTAAKPFRPHLPYPRSGWLWGCADVVVDSEPTNPADGEQVIEVRVVEPAEAQRLLVSDGDWFAELIDLALDQRR